jgi:hypothetical protein
MKRSVFIDQLCHYQLFKKGSMESVSECQRLPETVTSKRNEDFLNPGM